MRKLTILLLIFATHHISAQSDVRKVVKAGQVNLTSQNYAKAEKDFNSAMDMVQAKLQADFIKIDAYNKLSEYDKAVKEHPVSQEDRLLYIDMLYGRGVALYGQQKYNGALKDLNRALMLDEKHGPSYYMRGLCNIATSSKREGCLDLRTAQELGNRDALQKIKEFNCNSESDSYYSKGLDQVRKKDWQGAVESFTEAIKFFPDTTYLFQRGICYLNLQKYSEAIADFSAAIKKQPQDKPNYYYHLYRGKGYVGMKQWAAAYDDLTIMIDKDNTNFDAYLYRGVAAEGKKDLKGAKFDYQNLIRIDASSGMAHFKLGIVEYNMYLKDEACKEFKEASELGYEEADPWVKLCKLRKESAEQ